MEKRYKISATILKPGCDPVNWVRYENKAMIKKEAIELLNQEKVSEFDHKFKMGIELIDFKCEVVNE